MDGWRWRSSWERVRCGCQGKRDCDKGQGLLAQHYSAMPLRARGGPAGKELLWNWHPTIEMEKTRIRDQSPCDMYPEESNWDKLEGRSEPHAVRSGGNH
jgi:hypothetical protein